MRLPNIKLNEIEEYKNFSVDILLDKDYDLVSGGIYNTENIYNDFILIKIVNGIPVYNGKNILISEHSNKPQAKNSFVEINNKFKNIFFNIEIMEEIDKPLLFLNVLTSSNSFIPSNISIIAKNCGQIDILEVLTQEDGVRGVLVNNVREFEIENSTINYSRVDELNNFNSSVFNYNGFVNNGTLKKILLNNSGFININNWNIDLVSSNSNCFIFGVVKLNNSMRHGSVCKINHLAKETNSTQEFRHILDGNSYAMYDGDSTIIGKAKDSSTAQHSKTIMLSNNARIFNKPRLNIYTGEVKAKHGASVGKLDDEDIFYLKQRGLKDTIIKKLLVDAFVIDVIDLVESSKIREYLYDKR